MLNTRARIDTAYMRHFSRNIYSAEYADYATRSCRYVCTADNITIHVTSYARRLLPLRGLKQRHD